MVETQEQGQLEVGFEWNLKDLYDEGYRREVVALLIKHALGNTEAYLLGEELMKEHDTTGL